MEYFLLFALFSLSLRKGITDMEYFLLFALFFGPMIYEFWK